ncbi:unnamed protein product [Paramecium pentaurelia]|uniref:Uncharacterized protein n=1 Tax=Paramecium pentaurelia TaxID=43138 RepID=A0A8S1XDH4_9CILI|nr:unnamed protein product [Paramecium pentaurelia]
MDPLTRYKMKLEKDKQHLQEYERIQKEKELQNEMKLRQKNEKYNNIQQKQDRQKEVARLKAELRKNHIDRTLFQSQQIEQDKLNGYQQKIAKTLDSLEKYENGYHKDYLTSLHRKQSNHSHQIECVQQQNETILENKINKINQSLEFRFKKSEDVLSNLSKQNSDRKKSEKIKVETYQQLVQRHQERQQQLRDQKAQQFEEKLNKVDQLQKLKEQQQREKHLLRLEADKLKEKMSKEFEQELAKMKSKQIKLIQN